MRTCANTSNVRDPNDSSEMRTARPRCGGVVVARESGGRCWSRYFVGCRSSRRDVDADVDLFSRRGPHGVGPSGIALDGSQFQVLARCTRRRCSVATVDGQRRSPPGGEAYLSESGRHVLVDQHRNQFLELDDEPSMTSQRDHSPRRPVTNVVHHSLPASLSPQRGHPIQRGACKGNLLGQRGPADTTGQERDKNRVNGEAPRAHSCRSRRRPQRSLKRSGLRPVQEGGEGSGH